MMRKTRLLDDYWVETGPADAAPRPFSPRGIGRALIDTIVAVHLLYSAWSERARQRRHLAMLDDRALRDIGLSRADVWHETGKPFWMP